MRTFATKTNLDLETKMADALSAAYNYLVCREEYYMTWVYDLCDEMVRHCKEEKLTGSKGSLLLMFSIDGVPDWVALCVEYLNDALVFLAKEQFTHFRTRLKSVMRMIDENRN